LEVKIVEPLIGAFWGAVAGVGWGLLGYGRKKQSEPDTEFSPKYFAKTLVIGAALGIAAWYMNLPIETVAATPVADKIINIINGLFE